MADNSLAAAITSAAANSTDNLLNQGFAFWRDRISRDWQEKMWNKQNEYNLPINQRKRLEDAGINPNLAFGSSASAMGSSVPSSPHTSNPHWSAARDAAQFWLAYQQAKAQVRKDNAQSDAQEMQNMMFEMLFNDKFQTEKGNLYIERIRQAWNEDHLKDLLDAGLSEKEIKNDLNRVIQAYYDAQRLKTEQATKNLEQEYNHLIKKYGFEDMYYENHVNPYETSTPLGISRFIGGTLFSLIEYIYNLF